MKDFEAYLNEQGTSAPLNEAVVRLDTTKSRFGDSEDATSHVYGVLDAMKSRALDGWSKLSDQNYGTNANRNLRMAIEAYSKFVAEIEKANADGMRFFN